jgi:rhodanese-related sulfurtransferase
VSALPPEQVLQAVCEGGLELLDLRSAAEVAGGYRAWRRQGLPTER